MPLSNTSLPTAAGRPAAVAPTETEILGLQALAVRTNDHGLLVTTWAALGYSRGYAFAPVTPRERALAIQHCADQLEMIALMSARAA